jgi:hypothetical protein
MILLIKNSLKYLSLHFFENKVFSITMRIPGNSFKGVSDLKACLNYCEYPRRSCEKSNFCFPAQTVQLTEKPVELALTLLRGCLIFLNRVSFKTNGWESSNVYNFLPDLHNNLSTFLQTPLFKNH